MPEPRTMAVAQRKPSTKSLVLDTMFWFMWLQWVCASRRRWDASPSWCGCGGGGGIRMRRRAVASAAIYFSFVIVRQLTVLTADSLGYVFPSSHFPLSPQNKIPNWYYNPAEKHVPSSIAQRCEWSLPLRAAGIMFFGHR